MLAQQLDKLGSIRVKVQRVKTKDRKVPKEVNFGELMETHTVHKMLLVNSISHTFQSGYGC